MIDQKKDVVEEEGLISLSKSGSVVKLINNKIFKVKSKLSKQFTIG